MNQGLGVGEDDRVLWLLPMAHHFAASIVLYLANHATTVLVGSTLAGDVLGAARAHRDRVYGSPFHHAVLAADPSGVRWDTLRLSVSTAAALLLPRRRVRSTRASAFRCRRRSASSRPVSSRSTTVRAKPSRSVRCPTSRPSCAARTGVRSRRVKWASYVRGRGLLDGYLWPFRTRDRILDDGWFASRDLATADADGSQRVS